MKYNLCLCDPPEVGITTEQEQIEILNLVGRVCKPTGWVLEIGTFRGHTAQAIAQNFPTVTVITIDLPAGAVPVMPDVPDERPYYGAAVERSIITAPNVTRIFADSGNISVKALRENQWLGSFDLVFIDGGHSLPQVLYDTMIALLCCREGGIIAWHDYSDYYADTVVKTVNALFPNASKIEGTKLAWVQKGGEA